MAEEKKPQIIKEIGKLNREDSLGFWIAIGMMLGVVFGSAIESIGISVGIAIGMLAGIVLDCVFGSPYSSGIDESLYPGVPGAVTAEKD